MKESIGYEGRSVIDELEASPMSAKEARKYMRQAKLKTLLKFHNRESLVIGILAGMFLVYSGMLSRVAAVGILQMLIGGVLAIHCFDMIRYYKRHRIVKIEKTDIHRIVTKQ